MRQFLGVAVLGAVLALTTRAAFASDNVDEQTPFQAAQNEAIVGQTESAGSVMAGSDAPASVYGDPRYDNYGR